MSSMKPPTKSALKRSSVPPSPNALISPPRDAWPESTSSTILHASIATTSSVKRPQKSSLKKTKIDPSRSIESEIENLGSESCSMDGSDRFQSTADYNSISTNSSHQGKDGYELFGVTKAAFQAATCSRWMFLATLLLAAAGLASAAYVVLDKVQVECFQRGFETMAEEFIAASNNDVRRIMELMDGLSNILTSSILTDNAASSHPGFVTLPFVEEHFGPVRNNSGAMVISYLPLVSKDDLDTWNSYADSNQGWIQESIVGVSSSDQIFSTIWDISVEGDLPEDCEGSLGKNDIRTPVTTSQGPFAPIWTTSPPAPKLINKDMFGRPELKDGLKAVQAMGRPLFLESCSFEQWYGPSENGEDYFQAAIAYPVYDSFTSSADVVGYMIEVLPWKTFWEQISPDGAHPLVVHLESTCGRQSIYEVHGTKVKKQSEGQDYTGEYQDMVVSRRFVEFVNSPDLVDEGLKSLCLYTINIYPTRAFEEVYDSQRPIRWAVTVVAVFCVAALLFVLFDVIVTSQRNRVMETAKKQNALVSSLFPKAIQAKMMQDAEEARLSRMGKAGIKSYLNLDQLTADLGGHTRKQLPSMDKSKPIADLFPNTTIMFGDIAGFTAWSSTREPTQVFTLLETIYHAFDLIAKKQRVFKVEVVGDCYVAVCGLPDPRKDHAVAMVKFAVECVKEMNRVTQRLEIDLGPETADLKLRVGLHSGPVVAGVLRGDKSRFQLFGDTMNTASRMESTGIPNMVQISQETADLLEEAGKKHWFEPRKEKVEAKGKGTLNTFFLVAGKGDRQSLHTGTASSSASLYDDTCTDSDASSLGTFRDDEEKIEKRDRIANWTAIVMLGLLREIEARRIAAPAKKSTEEQLWKLERGSSYHENGDTVINEVAEIIELPKFNAAATKHEARVDVDDVVLPESVCRELKEFVGTIVGMYHQNPFHNFPHANHVTMSVVKLLSRIKAPDVADIEGTTLHDHTYGITSDPLTRFAVVFSALIHDVDHLGVPNSVLVKEGDPVAELYKDTSVAEQNSIDLAWDLLMEPRFHNLRRQIYTNESEYVRFRQLVVNAVMATDIMDKNLKELRNKRWAAAFAEDADHLSHETINRKATIVIEHLIQASDVAHTMQHWHIYRKWNERLFEEMYKAYEEGRLDSDPSEKWYEGEIGFFDFYVVPLAKKLKDCGVFGVSSDEYLNYAQQNRKEWESRGEQLCAEMLRNVKRKSVARQVFKVNQRPTAQMSNES